MKSDAREKIGVFLRYVMSTFAYQKQQDAVLVIKQHPRDRLGVSYSLLIEQLTESLGLKGKVFYGREFAISRALGASNGCVLMGNTVLGFYALSKSVPVKLMGESVYALFPGVLSTQSLESFIREPRMVDDESVVRMLNCIQQETQLAGTFRKCKGSLLLDIHQRMQSVWDTQHRKET
ncbi:capsular polysaccharide export protein, LipB/KpsS family [Vibrio agarivorans]|nr:hypothetical protein [Vibrio agarivorans]MDN3663353.1 hypothetical protein [Vibrio agarivorans]